MEAPFDPPVVAVPVGSPASGFFTEDYDSPTAEATSLLSTLPQWMSLREGLLPRVVSSISDPIGMLAREGRRTGAGIVPGDGDINAPRLIYVCQMPALLPKESQENRTLKAFFKRDSDYFEAQETRGWWHFIHADGPCFYILDNSVLFRNLERELVSSTGQAIEDGYRHSVTGSIRDSEILESTDYTLPSRRWLRHSLGTDTRPTENTYVISEESTAYFSVPKSSRAVATPIVFIVQGSSGTALCQPMSLRNSWDTQANKLGIVRRKNEDNYSLSQRMESVLLFESKEDRLGALLKAARTLGAVEFYTWDASAPLFVGTGHTQIIVANTPQHTWTKESLVPAFGSSGVFTLPKRDVGLLWLTLNNVPYEISSSDGQVELPLQHSGRFVRVEATLSYESWAVSGGYVLNKNLPMGEYCVAVISGLDGYSLSDSRLSALIREGQGLSAYAKEVLDISEKRYPFAYGGARWERRPFFTDESGAPSPAKIPLAFED